MSLQIWNSHVFFKFFSALYLSYPSPRSITHIFRPLPSYESQMPWDFVVSLFLCVFLIWKASIKLYLSLLNPSPLCLTLLSNSSTKFCVIGSMYFNSKIFSFLYIFSISFLIFFYPLAHAGHIFLYKPNTVLITAFRAWLGYSNI